MRRAFSPTISACDLPKNALIGELSTAERQIVQITRALLHQPKVLVFDEPTAALVRREAEILFRLIRRLRDEGVTIIYISHYLNEIEELCDHVTVLRNGLDVASLPIGETSAKAIASLMIERDITEMFPEAPGRCSAKTLLKVRALSAPQPVRRRQLHAAPRRGARHYRPARLRRQGSWSRTLFGLEQAASWRDRNRGRASTAAQLRRRPSTDGLHLCPEDRRGHGVGLDLSLAENITLPSLARYTRFGFLNRKP